MQDPSAGTIRLSSPPADLRRAAGPDWSAGRCGAPSLSPMLELIPRGTGEESPEPCIRIFPQWRSPVSTHVVILGAGFGGLELSSRLSAEVADEVRVTRDRSRSVRSASVTTMIAGPGYSFEEISSSYG